MLEGEFSLWCRKEREIAFWNCNRNISNKLSFPLIVFGFGTKPSTLTLVLLPPLDLSISMLWPSPPGLYYSLEGGILLLTALHLFNSFSLLSYSRSVCSWGFSLDYYVENHWIKLFDCRNKPSRWFLCFTIWRCCRYCDGSIMCSWIKDVREQPPQLLRRCFYTV